MCSTWPTGFPTACLCCRPGCRAANGSPCSNREFEAFARRADADEDTWLDLYAASGIDEFFAVASEAFFVHPHGLAAEHEAAVRAAAALLRAGPAGVRAAC
ncbi:MAG: zinc-dependent peptidase [Rubrivivax sp.]